MTLAAVMPLPEGLPELAFAGALGGRRVRLIAPAPDRLPIAADADFCITGTVDPERQLPEGPFGDHLGYYSLAHPFPVLNVEQVYHRDGRDLAVHRRRPAAAGRHQLRPDHPRVTGPIIPTVVAGVHAVHAVDAAGVHPLLLAIGSERYVPYAERRKPQELLTCANAILGQGQLSLAKYLLIVAREDDPDLDIHDIPAFFRHLLERVDWRTDLHFQTCTTIDTLDYSGSGLNEGSKLVIAAAGPPRRELADAGAGGAAACRTASASRASACRACWRCRRRAFRSRDAPEIAMLRRLCRALGRERSTGFPLIVLVDDSEFTAPIAEQLAVGDVHALQPGGRRARHRRVHAAEALGLHGAAGDRRPDQAAPRAAAGGGPGGDAARRCAGGAGAGRCTGSSESHPV